MDYKEKYEMALEGIQEILGSGEDSIKMSRLKLRLQGIFPELKESEDERIRKEIIQFLKLPHPQFVGNRNYEKWIDYLEKQGENSVCKVKIGETYKCISSPKYTCFHTGDIYHVEDNFVAELINTCSGCFVLLEKQSEQKSEEVDNLHNYLYGEQKLVDKVEPKFKVGDWVIGRVTNNEPRQISEVTEQCYKTTYGGQYGFSFEDEMHLWTIQDAKDGDVLVTKGDKRPFIFKGLLDSNHPNCPVAYCGISSENLFLVSTGIYWWNGKEVEPATKEQRDTLEKAMADAGYKWDADKKELKKIEQKPNDNVASTTQSYITPNQKFFQWIYDRLIHVYNENPNVDYMLSLKERIKDMPKPDWIEEDGRMIEVIIKHLERQKNYQTNTTNIEQCQNWLKSLKDRYTFYGGARGT